MKLDVCTFACKLDGDIGTSIMVKTGDYCLILVSDDNNDMYFSNDLDSVQTTLQSLHQILSAPARRLPGRVQRVVDPQGNSRWIVKIVLCVESYLTSNPEDLSTRGQLLLINNESDVMNFQFFTQCDAALAHAGELMELFTDDAVTLDWTQIDQEDMIVL